MYSPQSCIMTAHFVTLNPFSLAEQRRKDGVYVAQSNFPSANGGINDQEHLHFLKSYTVQEKQRFYRYDEQHTKVEAELQKATPTKSTRKHESLSQTVNRISQNC